MSAFKSPLVDIVRAVLDDQKRVRGTAFCVSRDGILATCAHVVEACLESGDNVWILDLDGTRKLVTEKRMDAAGDLAILFAAIASPPTLRPISTTQLRLGTEIASHGFPSDRPIANFPRGYGLSAKLAGDVEFVDARGKRSGLTVIGADICEGRSGSPAICCRTGHIVGVLSKRLAGTSEGIALRASELLRLEPRVEVVNEALARHSRSSSCEYVREGTQSLPFNLVRRATLFDQIMATLDTLGTAILVGPGGIGKTVLATEVAQEFEGNTAVILATQFEDRADLNAFDLVVLDGVEKESIPVLESWIRHFPGRLLVTTRNREVGCRVLEFRGQAPHMRSVVDVNGFTTDETHSFLEAQFGDRITPQERDDFQRRLHGHPFSLSALSDLLQPAKSSVTRGGWFSRLFGRGKSTDRVTHILPSGDIDVAVASNSLLQQWLVSRNDLTGQRALRALARTAIVGMSVETLASSLGVRRRDVERALEPALKNGFVRTLTHFRFPDFEMLVPHDILRSHLMAQPSDSTEHEVERRYLKLLSKDGYQNGMVSVAAELDRLCARMRVDFRDFWENRSGGHSIEDGVMKHVADVDALLSREGLSDAQRDNIASIFGEGLRPFIEDHCPVVIAIGHAFNYLDPAPTNAELIWPGSASHDTWARAVCIRAAVRHWAVDTGSGGVSRLIGWTEEYLLGTTSNYFLGSEAREVPTECDMDVATVAAGLVRLGEPKLAVSFMEEVWGAGYVNASHQTISFATVALALAEARETALSKKLWTMAPKEVHLTPHTIWTTHFLNFGVLAPPPIEAQVARFALTVAKASHSDAFYEHVKQHNTSLKTYL